MKIDQDLRAAINAAAKQQTSRDHAGEQKQLDAAVVKVIDRRPAVKRRILTNMRTVRELEAKRKTLAEKIRADLKPLGLVTNNWETIKANFRIDALDDEDMDRFLAAGGVLPPPHRRTWKAEEVIARLAGAEPSARDAILKEYGINWN